MCGIAISSAFAVEVELGETISYDELELSFYDIEDSRCPLDVTCIWEGEVIAKPGYKTKLMITMGILELEPQFLQFFHMMLPLLM